MNQHTEMDDTEAGVKEHQSVQFHEKESGSASDAGSVWTLTDQGDGTIAAEPPQPD